MFLRISMHAQVNAFHVAGSAYLRHLDLYLIGVCEVVGCHTETSAGDLLDRTAPVIMEAPRILTAFAYDFIDTD